MLQIESSECGVVCLAIILAYHGRWVPVETLRDACGVSRDGTNASSLLKAARLHGLETKGFSLDEANFEGMPLPAIIHWRFNHFVVLEGFDGRRYRINDPANGRMAIDAETFGKAFTGVFLQATPEEDFEKSGQPPNWWRSVRSYAEEVRSSLLLTSGLALALVIPGVLLPIASIVFVDYILVQSFDDWLKPLLIGMGGIAIVQVLLTSFQRRMALVLQTRLSILTGSRLMSRSMRLPMKFFAQRAAAEMASRAQLTDQVAGLVAGPLAMSAIGLLTAILYFGVMLFFSPLMAAAVALLGLLNLAFFVLQFRQVREINQSMIRENTLFAGAQMQSLRLLPEVEASGMKEQVLQQIAGRKSRALNQQGRLVRRQAYMQSLPVFLRYGSVALVLFVGGQLVIAGSMTLGVLIAFQGLVMQFLSPIQQALGYFEALQSIPGTVERIEDVTRYPVESELAKNATKDDAAATNTSEKDRGKPILRMEQVTFGYQPMGLPLLKNFDLELRPGKWTALVGPSSSGKSTIVRLLARLHSPWSGSITLAGRPIGAYEEAELRSRVALVDQNIVLFNGSVSDNLSLWSGDLRLEQQIRAARAAHIHDWIINRPAGYDHRIGEGGNNLSGGEKARLDIARALATEPDLIILDEATAALDSLTEAKVLEGLREHVGGGLLVSHRLAAVRDFDEIIVFVKGRPVQRGDHATLMRDPKGHYRKLWDAEEGMAS